MKKGFFLLVFVLLSAFGQSQWIQVNGPADPFMVQDIIAKDSLLLVSASHASFSSSDGGSTWNPAMPETFVASALFHDTIYTGGESYPYSGPSNFIRKMIFYNGTWQSASALEYPGLVNDMFADEDKILIACSIDDGYSGTGAGFSYSADGKNWFKHNTGLPKDSVLTWTGYFYTYNLFAVSANHQYIFTGSKKGIYRSPGTGFDWSAKNNGLPAEKVNAIFSNDTVLIIAIQNKLYKSSDQGESWAAIYTLSAGNAVNRIRLINDTLFALTQTQGLYLSVDGGSSWSTANTGLTSLRVNCIVKQGPTWFLGGGSGISKGLDHWETCNNNIICSDIRDLEQTGTCIAASEIDGVFISKDEGLTWDQRTPFQIPGVMYSIVNVDGCLFLSFNPGWPVDCINYLSCDNGDTWSQTAPLVNIGDPFSLRSNGSKMIATDDNVIYFSADKGSTWANITPPAGMIVNDFSDVVFTGNDLYISAEFNTAQVIHSADFGVTWNHCDAGLGDNNIYKLGYASGTLFAFNQTHLFKSADQGQTWLECSSLGDAVVDFTNDGDMIFACKNTRVYFSRDMGLHWTDISAGLPPLPNLWAGTLMVRDHYLYFGTFTFGIWKISTQNLPSSVNELPAICEFEVYPNPADNEINIVSRGDQHIKNVDILDLSGRVVDRCNFTGNKIAIDFLSPNLYILQIETMENMRYHEKFVKH